jgi:predicted RNase H-like HicB family nuclease
MRKFKITFNQTGEGWMASILTVPGCHADGATQDEARENVKAALLYFYDDVDVVFTDDE